MLLLTSQGFAAPPLLDPQVHELRLRTRPKAQKAQAPSPHNWDVTHYAVDIEVDGDAINATATISATRLADGPLILHERGLQDLVTSLPYTDEDDGLHFDVEGDSVELTASWRSLANPFGGLMKVDDVLYTSSEPEGARQWLLCFDDPSDRATLDWTIHAPTELTVAAVGDFVDVTDEGDTRAWHWRTDIPTATYLYAFHVGDYVLTKTNGAIPIWTWAYPDSTERAADGLADTSAMLDYLSSVYGPYVFGRYGNVLVPGTGGMENPQAVSYGADLLDYGETAALVNVHEMGHHWFGDDLTPGTWDDIWLNEGFATYTELLWYEHLYGDAGRTEYAGYLVDSWLASGETSSVYAPDFLFGSTVYEKGGMVVHMLRGVLGEDAFFAALRTYEERYHLGTVTTPDLQAVMEEEYGASLDWFFEEWVYGNATPEFDWTMATTPYEGGTQVELHVEADGFRMPVPVRVYTSEGPRDVIVDGDTTVCLDGEVTDAQLDPDRWVLWSDAWYSDGEAGPLVCAEEAAPAGCGCASAGGGWISALLALGLLRRR